MQYLPKVTLLTGGNDVTRISPKGLGECLFLHTILSLTGKESNGYSNSV